MDITWRVSISGGAAETTCKKSSPFENAHGDSITAAPGGPVRYKWMRRKFDLRRRRRQTVSYIRGNVRFTRNKFRRLTSAKGLDVSLGNTRLPLSTQQ